MKFYIISCSDSSVMGAEIPGAVWLARGSSVVGDGPDGYYLYRRLFAHPGDPDLSDVSRVYDCIGRSRYSDPLVSEVTRDEAERFARSAKPMAPSLTDFPPTLRDRVASARGSYDARNGMRSAGCDTIFFIEILADFGESPPPARIVSSPSFGIAAITGVGRESEIGRFASLPDALASITAAAKKEGVTDFERILDAPYGRYRYGAWVGHRGGVHLDYRGVA